MKKTTQQFALELKERHNLTLIGEYLGAAQKVSFLCPNGHTNSASATNVLQRGYNCKECKHGRAITSKVEWSDERLEELKGLINVKSTEEIAEYFNTTKSSIDNTCFKFKIARDRTIDSRLELLEVLKAQQRELLSEYTVSHSYIKIKCSNNHIVEQLASNVIYKHTDCPDCFHAFGKSKKELELREFIQDNYSGWIELSDRSILNGKELDIVLPDLGLAFEYNGNYWHSDVKVDKSYHYNKTQQTEAFGYQLIHIYEYNDLNIVKSRILQLLGKSTKIYARKCTIKEISWPKEFLEQNHIQGAGAPTKYNFGLFHKDELVAVMTFSKSRFNKDYEYELYRYCSKLNTTVVGGASKLFKFFNPTSVVSYAARDWSQGRLYKALGFEYLYTTDPGYCYTSRTKVVSRYRAQKHNLETLLEDYEPELTEEQNMNNAGYHRVYDSGNLVFGFTK